MDGEAVEPFLVKINRIRYFGGPVAGQRPPRRGLYQSINTQPFNPSKHLSISQSTSHNTRTTYALLLRLDDEARPRLELRRQASAHLHIYTENVN